jgi:hypothetical protein
MPDRNIGVWRHGTTWLAGDLPAITKPRPFDIRTPSYPLIV